VARPWTRADDARLRRCYAGSEPVAEIAGALARSPDAVGRRLQALSHRLERSPAAIPEPADQRARDSQPAAYNRISSGW
jgi:hypothetical protein